MRTSVKDLVTRAAPRKARQHILYAGGGVKPTVSEQPCAHHDTTVDMPSQPA